MYTLALAPQVSRDKARCAAGSGSTGKGRNAGSGNLGCQPRRGSAAFARARRCGSLVQNDCTAITAPCSHTKATRARACTWISVSLGAWLILFGLRGLLGLQFQYDHYVISGLAVIAGILFILRR